MFITGYIIHIVSVTIIKKQKAQNKMKIPLSSFIELLILFLSVEKSGFHKTFPLNNHIIKVITKIFMSAKNTASLFIWFCNDNISKRPMLIANEIKYKYSIPIPSLLGFTMLVIK